MYSSYGFTNVLTPADIIMACPHIMPFVHSLNHYASFARPLPRPLQQEDRNNRSPPLESRLKIDAILVFNDSRDWALDIQIILDLLLSQGGVLGTTSRLNNDESLPNRGFQQDGQPPLYFSNPDLLWAAHYHLPRLGQGGFREALEGVWNALTGGEGAGVKLQKHMFGKPHQATFEFAEKRLIEHREKMFGLRGDEEGKSENGLRCVYMVGGMSSYQLISTLPIHSPSPPFPCLDKNLHRLQNINICESKTRSSSPSQSLSSQPLHLKISQIIPQATSTAQTPMPVLTAPSGTQS